MRREGEKEPENCPVNCVAVGNYMIVINKR